MATNVLTAFAQFQAECVDLEPSEVAAAQGGLTTLIHLIDHKKGTISDFPPLAGGSLATGFFSRGTKPKPLDNLELMVPLEITEARLARNGFVNGVHANGPDCPLWPFKRPDNHYIDSGLVLQNMKAGCAVLPGYQAYVEANGTAVTVGLPGCPWVYDVTPALPIVDAAGATTCYLVPDGNGHWYRTDPRQDNDAVRAVDRRHNGNLLAVVRMLMFWNFRPYKPVLPSAYFEQLVMKAFARESPIMSQREAIKIFFEQMAELLTDPCPDPKGLAPDYDAGVDKTIKLAVGFKATEAANHAADAMVNETYARNKDAVESWRKIFGPAFPAL